MDPYYEQRLRDEVLYLHSLWHLGPPTNPNPNPNPNLTHHQNPSTHLHLSNPTQFKKEKKKKKNKKHKRGKKGKSDPPWISDIEWPCKTPSEISSSSGWPVLNLQLGRIIRMPSANEQARFAATQAQQKALKASQEFFAAAKDSDGEEDDDSDDDDLMDEDGNEEYSFFMKMFTEDGELRGFYEKNCEGGDFSCLVCEGIGKKIGKRFKGCVALVQHSVSIAKTKKKQAHRALAQVICKVLGWNIDRLPTIVLSLGDPLSRSLAKSGESQGNAEDLHMLNQNSGSVNVNNGELIVKEVSNVGQEGELHNSSVPGISNVDGDNVMLCEGNAEIGMEDLHMLNQNSSVENVNNGELVVKEVSNVGHEGVLHNSSVPGMSSVNGDNVMLYVSSLKVGDANECTENLENGDSSEVDGKTEGVVNGLEPFKDNGTGNNMKNNQTQIVANDLKDNNGDEN
ncbi:unnamed protein product [Camellia sinensis]